MVLLSRVALIGVVVLLQLSLIVSATTWTYQAPRALLGLAGSASAAVSTPDTPSSVIADLRGRKAAQLQEDKLGLEPLEETSDEDSEGPNEASPSLLKKKIGKILTKLRLIAQLKNAYHYKPEEQELDNSTLDSTQGPPEVDGVHFSENIQQIPLAASPKLSEKLPVIVDLKVNQIDDKLQDLKQETIETLEEGRRSPLGSLGVFFAELLGSIVGLTYGAVAQISAGGQSPVSLSTSEGL